MDASSKSMCTILSNTAAPLERLKGFAALAKTRLAKADAARKYGSGFLAKREEIGRGPTLIQSPRREVQEGKHTSHNIP